MKIKLFILIVLIFCLETAALAASSSASYKITTETICSAGQAATSASYRLNNCLRERELQAGQTSSYKIGEGFMRTAYFSGAILAPIVASISPPSATSGSTIALTVSGANFTAGAAVTLSLTGQSTITATSVVVDSSAKITCNLALTGAVPGLWTVTVTNSDGRSGSLPSALTIAYAEPTVTSITPSSGINTAAVTISDLAGTNFRSGATVKLQKAGQTAITASSVSVISATKITCVLDIKQADPGMWDVVVTNDDNKAGTLSQGFKVNAPELYATVPVKVGSGAETNMVDFSKSSAVISYSLSKDADIIVFVFNMRGEKIWEQRIAAGADGGKPGPNAVEWNGITAFSSSASAGVYFIYVNVYENGNMRTLTKTKFAVVKWN